MERIQRALERARSEQHRRGTPPVYGPRPVPENHEIHYTQTRVHEVAPEYLRDQRIIDAYEPGSFTEAYRVLRTQVLQRLRDNGWNTLAITSAADNEGKTLTAINLAISLASEVTCTVLLVDADIRRPRLHGYFGLQPENGLGDYLAGATDDVGSLLVHPSGIKRLVLLPGGRPQPDSASLLSAPRMLKLIDELKNRYPSRIVLFDLPPLLSAADALAFTPHIEAALLVVEEGGSSSGEVVRAAELLQKTHLIGTVLNKSLTGRVDATDTLLLRANQLVRFVFNYRWIARIGDGLHSGLRRLRRRLQRRRE